MALCRSGLGFRIYGFLLTLIFTHPHIKKNNMSHDANAHSNDMVKTIWRTFWIMLIVTIIEIVGALIYPPTAPRLILNIFFIVMSLLKAFYIVGVFMHLKFEMKHLIITILVPTIFLLYAVVILLAEGQSWLNMQLSQ